MTKKLEKYVKESFGGGRYENNLDFWKALAENWKGEHDAVNKKLKIAVKELKKIAKGDRSFAECAYAQDALDKIAKQEKLPWEIYENLNPQINSNECKPTSVQ